MMTNASESNPSGNQSVDPYHDRRDFKRIHVGGIAMLRPTDRSDAVQMGKVFDVSASGLSVLLKRPITPNTALELMISVDDPENQFLIRGTVMWCRPNNEPIDADPEGEYAHRAGIIVSFTPAEEDAIDWRALFLA